MAKDYAYGRVVVWGIFFLGKISHIHIHLPNVLMSHRILFQINQYEAFQNTMVKDQIHMIVSIPDGEGILPSHKSKALAQFQQKSLKIIYQLLLQITLLILLLTGHPKEFKRISVSYDVFRALNHNTLLSQLQDTLRFFVHRQSKIQGTVYLPAEGTDIPIPGHAFFFIKAAF